MSHIYAPISLTESARGSGRLSEALSVNDEYGRAAVSFVEYCSRAALLADADRGIDGGCFCFLCDFTVPPPHSLGHLNLNRFLRL